jgi:large subunit ribosomal protein L15
VKLHDLKPAPGSRTPKRRVGRGIAAGQGKTAGRGTKGQKARAGGKIPAWFEGGQTPLHQRIPKLHGFRNAFRIEYEVVNVGSIGHLVETGALEGGEMPGTKRAKGGSAPITVNQELLRAAGLVRTLDKPMKVLGSGELSAALFVVADAFSASARSKIEAAGGSVNVLEVPGAKKKALKGGPTAETGASEAPEAAAASDAPADVAPESAAAPEDAADAAPDAAASKRTRKGPAVAEAAVAEARAASASDEPVAAEPAAEAEATPAAESAANDAEPGDSDATPKARRRRTTKAEAPADES